MWTGEARLKRLDFWAARTRKEYAIIADFALLEGELDLNLYSSFSHRGLTVEWEWAEWDTGTWPGEGRFIGEVTPHWPLEALAHHHLLSENEPLSLTLSLAALQVETEKLEHRISEKMASVDWDDDATPAAMEAWVEALQAELVQS